MLLLLKFFFLKNFIVLSLFQDSTTSDEGGEFILLSLAIWLISLFIVRWRISKFILRMMNKTSNKTVNDQPDELKASEVKAKNKPLFEDLTKDSDRSLAKEMRELFVKRAFLLFRKKLFFGLLAVLMYFIIPFGLNYLIGDSNSDKNEMPDIIIGFIILYLIFICLNYYFYRKQFRAQDAHFGIRFEHPYVTLLRKIVNPTIEAYLSFFVIFIIFGFGLMAIGLIEPEESFKNAPLNTWFGIGLIIASLIHLFTFFKIRRIAQKEPNQALLILRVFGDKKQAELTFGKITNFWKHFGSWFTVADPSFIKRQNGFFTFKTLFTLLILFSLAGLLAYTVLAPFISSIFHLSKCYEY